MVRFPFKQKDLLRLRVCLDLQRGREGGILGQEFNGHGPPIEARVVLVEEERLLIELQVAVPEVKLQLR